MNSFVLLLQQAFSLMVVHVICRALHRQLNLWWLFDLGV